MPYDPALDRYLEEREKRRKRRAAIRHHVIEFLGCLIASIVVGLMVSTVLSVAFFVARHYAK